MQVPSPHSNSSGRQVERAEGRATVSGSGLMEAGHGVWNHRLTAASFVRSIQTVSISITLPAAVDALPAATAELQGMALARGDRHGGFGVAALGPLVRAVGAVDVAVAGPQARDADAVVALEGCRAAGDGRAGGLIAAVVAVLIFVTHEGA